MAEAAVWKATGRSGDHNGVNHVEYELLDSAQKRVSLAKTNVSSIEKDGVKTVPDDQETLWFSEANATKKYKFNVVTLAGTTYEAELNWTQPNPPKPEPTEWDTLIAEKITLAKGLGIMGVWNPKEGYKLTKEYGRIAEIDKRLWELVK
ncbi:hypothetical protein MF628_004956 [Paenibacillus polymyxa]|uniref:hypothetical protein n=1 Tax=Paenibacillus polymyxa TaxID=1406 RepID=UPI002024E3DD|nr:hypothetical protein [Paenibacillus polymyxa]URJ45171.1 hypothetical protein MF628_004956 [Paenibacillus polymyxa]